MEWSNRFETAFSLLLNLIETNSLIPTLDQHSIYNDLGSISNIEIFLNPRISYFNNLSDNTKINLLKFLVDLDKSFGVSREDNWYYANLYAMIFNATYPLIEKARKIELLDYILITRKNERIPFGKDLDLKYNSYRVLNDLPFGKLKKFHDLLGV